MKTSGQWSGVRGQQETAYLSEIFSSIQGEGLLVGLRQIFVRFSGCSLTCDYCDTPESRVQSSEFIVHSVGAHGGAPNIISNPVSSEKLTEIVKSFNTHPNLHHSVSLTGGEPLEQADFLKVWLTEFKGETGKRRQGEGEKKSADSPKIYLETNGLLPAHLSEVIDFIDIIGMDIKLPSVSGMRPAWNLHRDFLKIASEREVFVKVVVARRVDEADIMRAVELVDAVDSNIPFILQPQTPLDLEAADLFRLQEIASRKLSHVRLIPQVHKLLNIR